MKRTFVIVVTVIIVSMFFSVLQVSAYAGLPQPDAKKTQGVKETKDADKENKKTPEPQNESKSNPNSDKDKDNNGNANGLEKTKTVKEDKNNPLISTNASAQSKSNQQGKIAGISSDSLTLTMPDGAAEQYTITTGTVIKVPGLDKPASVEDIPSGSQIVVQAYQAEDGSQVARYVLAIPAQPVHVHNVGLVTAYTPGQSITIKDQDGNLSTFQINGDVQILPGGYAGDVVASEVTIVSPRSLSGGTPMALGIVIHSSSP